MSTDPNRERVEALAAELAGVKPGEDRFSRGSNWNECLRSDDPYCWADPDEVAEAIVKSAWLRDLLAEAWDEGYGARVGFMELRNDLRREDNPYREADA